MKNRDNVRMKYDILKILSDGGMNKTRIMQSAFLSYSELRDNLSALDKVQLLRRSEDMDEKIYLTDKGSKFIKKYEELVKIFDVMKMK